VKKSPAGRVVDVLSGVVDVVVTNAGVDDAVGDDDVP
jgi:hypothetical protein